MAEPVPPEDPKQLSQEIYEKYEQLSDRLQVVAKYAIDFPDDMAIETIAILAERAGVQPSVLIRFAKAFGYSGFTEMQQVFRKRLRQQSPNYNERVRMYWDHSNNKARPKAAEIVREFAHMSKLTLEQLEIDADNLELEKAVKLLKKARIIHVVGQRRSFPVACYLAYALNNIEQPAVLLDGIGGLQQEQMRVFDKRDLLVAISFDPYAGETLQAVDTAISKGMTVIGFTDSRMSPLAKKSGISFVIQDVEVRSFRSLTAVLCLTQAIIISLALESAQRR